MRKNEVIKEFSKFLDRKFHYSHMGPGYLKYVDPDKRDAILFYFKGLPHFCTDTLGYNLVRILEFNEIELLQGGVTILKTEIRR